MSYELEKKDDEISVYKNKLIGIDNYRNQIESYKRQVIMLDHKLKEYEDDSSKTTNYYNDQFKHVKEIYSYLVI